MSSNIWNNVSTIKASTISSVGSNGAEVCISKQLKEKIKRYVVEELFSNEDSADFLNITINYLRKELEKVMDNPEIITKRNKEEEKIVELVKMIDELLCSVNILENRLDQLQGTINALNDRLRKLEDWSSHFQSILSSSPNTPNSPNITWSTSSTGPHCIL